ncbi:hypothetical protein FQN57_005211 [Myotisia sp. PD_48]|nr:hypothetical protein FQN57_005211 [Myotisia sp. PD_48]
MLISHKATNIDAGLSTTDSVVSIPVKSHPATQRRAKLSIRSSASFYDEPARDEDAFASRYLTQQGSIYFRKRKSYPRCFSWRVVGDSTALEIRAVDLTKSTYENTKHLNDSNSCSEANLTLRLEFEETIVPQGVALADVEEHEYLSVFVITASKQLYTFTLRPEYFRKVELIDENVSDWCKSCQPAPLSFSFPHRLYATSPFELFLALDSGALLRLTRKTGDDGSTWFPITFDEKSWSFSLRGLVKWNGQDVVKYNDRLLDPNTPNAIATSPDQTLVFVVGLNHSLKVWNLASQRLVASKDLLDRTNPSRDAPALTLNPADSAFIRLFNAERATTGDLFYLATYSPHEDGQFKFWAVSGGLIGPLQIEDLFADTKLRPPDPDPSGNVFWNVLDFQIKAMDEGKNMAIWVLWKSHNSYRLYSLHFDLLDVDKVWDSSWTMTEFKSSGNDIPPNLIHSDVTITSERWMNYLFEPGRYSPEVLRTAFTIYQDAMKHKRSSASARKSASSSMQQEISTFIMESVPLRKLPGADIDLPKYYRDLETKWQQLWQVVDDVNSKTHEAIGLAYDPYSDLPWLMFSGGSALIRECNGTELFFYNDGQTLNEHLDTIQNRFPHRNLNRELGEHPSDSAYLSDIAAAFRKSFAPELIESCQAALNSEIFIEPSLSAAERVEAFHTNCGFADGITEDMFEATCANIEKTIGYKGISNDLFFSLTDTLPLGFHGKDSDLTSTDFGRHVVVQGTLDVLKLSRQLIYDLLLLAVFIETELNLDDNSKFDGAGIFSVLTETLKEYEMMNWLGSNVRQRAEKSRSSLMKSNLKLTEESNTCTILEDLFALNIKPRPSGGISQTYAITQQIRDVISWITRQGEVTFPNVLVFIQCDLLACNNLNLASDFLRFQPSTAWATYVKGRLYLAKSDFDTAATYFQKAAYLLSHGKAVGNLHEMSSNLLDIISVDHFYNGLPKYFQHIVTLFELGRAFVHVAEFASLALETQNSDPEHSLMSIEDTNIRSDLLSRLFHASLKTCQFDCAYSALSRYTDLALQKSALTSLVTTVLTAYGPGISGLQKVLNLPLSLTPHLCSHVDYILSSLASKQSPLGSSLEQAVPMVGWQTLENTPDYYRVLKAYRVARNDIRGAAEISYQTVRRLRELRDKPASAKLQFLAPNESFRDLREIEASVDDDDEDDIESKELRNELLSLINLLACMGKDEAYIVVTQETDGLQAKQHQRRVSSVPQSQSDEPFVSSLPAKRTLSPKPSAASLVSLDSPTSSVLHRTSELSHSQSGPRESHARRIVVSLDDLRREYQNELDRVSRIRTGKWEFGAVEGDLEMSA